MGKVFTVTIGGKERVVRFTTADAIELKKRFNKAPAVLLLRDVLGFGEDDKQNLALVDVEVQNALLLVCLRRGGTRCSEESLLGVGDKAGWVDEHLQKEGATISQLLLPCVRAAFYSGAVLGQVVDLDTYIQPAEDSERKLEPEKALGKGDTPATDG